jgi:hypothetical protein
MKGGDMYSNSDLGRARQADRMREAAAYRMAGETSAAQAAERRATVRRVLGTAVSLLLWPIRH